MKSNSIFISVILASALMFMWSCKRDYSILASTQSTNGMAFLRLVDASPNFRILNAAPDSFNVYVNGNKVTGFTVGGAGNYELTYNAFFPTVSSNYGYIGVPAGTTTLKLTAAGVVNPDSIPILTLTKTLLPNSYYSFIITDSLKSSRDSSQIFVQDIYPLPNIGFFNLRFIHAVLNDTLGKTVDIWSTRMNRYLWTAIKPGTITSFQELPYNSLLTDTLYVRRSGTVTNLAFLNTVSFSLQRTYSLLYKGDGNLTTGTKTRALITYVHQ